MSAKQAIRPSATCRRLIPSQPRRPQTLSVRSKHTFIAYPSTSRHGRPTRPVLYQQPATFLQTFSYTATRALEFTDSALRYYVTSPSGASLRYGYERWIKRPEEALRLDPILRSIERVIQKKDANSGPGKGKKWLSRMALVTRRKIMTRLLMAPYERSDTVELNAMLVGGTLYLEGHAPDPQVLESSLSSKERKLMYYGSAFEAWSTSSQPGIPEQLDGHPAGWSGDVNTYIQWLAIAEASLGDHRLLMGGELDCVRGRFDGRPHGIVELKTTSMRKKGDEARFTKKLLKYYIQSYLMGVPEIVVGFRTPKGELATTQTYKTAELPRLVRNKQGAWRPEICWQWGQFFLSSLRTMLARQAFSGKPSSGHSARVWRVILTPNKGVTIFPLKRGAILNSGDDEQRYGLLPTWYLHQIGECAG